MTKLCFSIIFYSPFIHLRDYFMTFFILCDFSNFCLRGGGKLSAKVFFPLFNETKRRVLLIFIFLQVLKSVPRNIKLMLPSTQLKLDSISNIFNLFRLSEHVAVVNLFALTRNVWVYLIVKWQFSDLTCR